jgi:hypothetical protein
MPEPADSGLYAYGIVPSGSPVPDHLRGMDGRPVELVTDHELAALVTGVSLPRPPGRRRDLLSHSEVLNTLAAEQDVIPLKFGTVFPDAGSIVHDLLAARSASLARLLDRVRDAVQLNLRASYVEERVLAGVVRGNREIRELRDRTRGLPIGAPHPDALHLGRLVSGAIGDLRREDSEMLAERVLPLARESRVRERATTDHVLDVALLVDRESVTFVEAKLERVAAEVHERIRLQLTGPLAPFDFLEEEPWG